MYPANSAEIAVVNVDGSPAGGGGYEGSSPNWSPDGVHIAYEYARYPGDPGDIGIDGQLLAIPGSEFGPAWSPDGQKIAYYSNGVNQSGPGTYAMNPDGTGITKLNDVANTWLDWQSLRPGGYARPKAATPTTVRLVPAYKACTSVNGTHGAPLALPSCSPPVQESGYATIGHGDGHPTAPLSTGSVTLKTVGESPIDPNNGDQADVQLTASITDVRNVDFSDYTGELRVSSVLRITDRYNAGPASPPIHPATSTDTPFGFAVTCLPTASGTIGSTCSASTTADAVLPGFVLEGKRAIWGLGQVQVYDGGADGDADTTGDNTLFAVQGLFAP